MQKKPTACITVDFKMGKWGAFPQFQAKNEINFIGKHAPRSPYKLPPVAPAFLSIPQES